MNQELSGLAKERRLCSDTLKGSGDKRGKTKG